ncbi:MAG TPA: glycosyltransferase family 39 protein [Bryobacteraceae bacterium]|nr:glycosyltransferase family 39 protein [Bryobacteraceae bacterium]
MSVRSEKNGTSQPLGLAATLAILAGLAILAYLPLFSQPLLEDDYPLIRTARDSGLHILTNPIFAVRSTGLLMMDGVHALFGMHAAAYYAAMILLHILNTWLVYAVGCWREIGYHISLWAAASFAVAEGHQEAVMWVASAPEPMQFLFGVGALVCWLRFLRGGRWGWLAVSLAAFVIALYSKESAVIGLPLLALPLVFDGALRKKVLYLTPFVAIAALGVARIVRTQSYSFRFNDGSFSLHAPFWQTWPISFTRLFWFWGMLAVIALFVWKPPRYASVLGIGWLWAGIGLVPYSFLTYSTRIPSRQTYLASVGVALIVGCAFRALMENNRRRWVVAAVAAVFVVHNVAYLWTKKRANFLQRAAPTEQLIELVRKTDGPVYVRCFPRPPIVAEAAVELTTGRKDLIWDAAQSGPAKATFCY